MPEVFKLFVPHIKLSSVSVYVNSLGRLRQFNVEKWKLLQKYKSCTPLYPFCNCMYRQVSNISRTLVGNKIVDHSDEVGASPVGAAPTTSSFST